MCRPDIQPHKSALAPATLGITDDSSLSQKTIKKNKSSFSSCLQCTSLLVLFFAVIFPIFLSEAIAGWTHKHTSPIHFSPSTDIGDLTGKLLLQQEPILALDIIQHWNWYDTVLMLLLQLTVFHEDTPWLTR
jgi:hypothetical protein